MTEIMHLNTDKSRMEPDAVYINPIALVNELGLNRGQKIASLNRWNETVQDHMLATTEGMPSVADQSADEAATVVEIAQALALLRGEPVDPTA